MSLLEPALQGPTTPEGPQKRGRVSYMGILVTLPREDLEPLG